ncbi:family 20 glycosylhydrolase [Streptomyces sp. BE20]|uniref:beta-N-acetylhexosaminidase n=1 Tax=Streptomyces sp. BE20 TaxID=3002525 RepID=UPI002E76290D|nr:family 20 glycosylhydrolase [Streptomyces sp. BE20]MEE1828004.1 family 20 glycosylhydrolase [Streptomyces sp. BE20]
MPIRTAGLSARARGVFVLAAVLLLAAVGFGVQRAAGGGDAGPGGGAGPAAAPAGPRTADRIVPAPLSATTGSGPGYRLTARTAVRTATGPDAPAQQAQEVRRIAGQLAEALRRPTGLPVEVVADGDAAADGIGLLLDPALPAETGAEGYRLTSDATGVRISARTPEGLYRGTQTLRQLLPPQIEGPAKAADGTEWTVAPVTVEDRPRYAYRGAMLDVARHFFTPAEVKGFIDRLALYKVNHLHLHLTDDQGWRIEIPSRPELTRVGAVSEVDGTPGGFYTAADYQEIVRYAQERYLTVVPEIDLPGHSNAVLASYPELDCTRSARPWPYTGIEVGFSTLCPTGDAVFAFTREVIAEVARLTPGPYLHIGGDEVKTISSAEYAGFVQQVNAQVLAAGKTPVGWNQAAPAGVGVLQYWDGRGGRDVELGQAAERGAKVIMSPSGRSYLDMKYEKSYPLGLVWAGTIDARHAYTWDPDNVLKLPAGSVIGIEAPLWTETLDTPYELDLMLLPRLPALAELGWSPKAALDWDGFKRRLAEEGARWDAAGYAYERRPEVPWPAR